MRNPNIETKTQNRNPEGVYPRFTIALEGVEFIRRRYGD